MSSLGTILIALAKVVGMALRFYSYVVLAAVILSWVNPDPYNPIVRFLRQATEPVFSRIRRILPRSLMQTGIDWTPMAVFLLLYFLQMVVTTLLFDLGMKLRHGTPPLH